MAAKSIRPIAICAFRRDGRILVIEARDSVKEHTFYRPIGGGIEFGETSAAAIIRETREEIGAEVVDLKYLGTLENIFTHNGAAHHEIVQVYDGRLADESLYSAPSIPGVESNGAPIHIVWKPLNSFNDRAPLYPDGILELLNSRQP